ncbi:MAG: alternative ribosome rescue aminoacyl-tRNA hydrolase ArfB [Bacteroidia bacterium]
MAVRIDFLPELTFQTSRSGGKGGQNVNKVESRVELLFDVEASQLLTSTQKQQIKEKLGNRINSEGILKLASESQRSQIQNKKLVVERFYDLLEKALRKRKRRVPTKVPRSVKEKRLREKRIQAEKKERRKPE